MISPTHDPQNFLGYDVQLATAGDLGSGGAGETSGALNPAPFAFSRYAGGPGGGGGGRIAGYAGDPPRANPAAFPQVRVGRGGDARGDETIAILGGGGGGGGGGATVLRGQADVQLLETQPLQGTGGGSGGGAIHIAANGDVVFGAEASIQVNGGDGGFSDQRSGPGGGGSTILIQVSGNAIIACEALQFEGGLRGIAAQTNREPFSDDGAPGRARVEANEIRDNGCSPAPDAETHLTNEIDDDHVFGMEVATTAGSAVTGYLLIDDEIVRYTSRDANSFDRVRRGELGTNAVAHDVGAAVRQIDPGIDRPSTGEFFVSTVRSDAVSTPGRLGIGPSQSVFTHDLEIDTPETFFGSGGETQAPGGAVLWELAFGSLDNYGAPGEFHSGVADVESTAVADFYRFRAVLRSDASTGVAPELDEIRLKYRMPR